MKKRLLLGLTALATLALASCQKDQVINEVPQDQAIEFGTYLGRDAQTKGTATTSENISNFGVFSYYTTTSSSYDTQLNSATSASQFKPNFMDNVNVSRTQTNSTWGNWSYSPLKYWPKGNDEYRLSFFAYSPYKTDNNGIEINYSENGSPTLKYTIPTTGVSAHQDILFAPITQNKEITRETNSYTTDKSTVKFHFYHALSRLGFKVKAAADYTGASIKVNSISIVGKFEKDGIMNLATAKADDVTNNPGWTHSTTNTTEDVTYSVSVDSGTQISSSDYASFSDNFIMTFPKYFAGYRLTINVNYTVSYTSPQSLSIENNVSVPISQAIDFHAGKAYTFNLAIGLDAINFTADVEAWPTETVISL